MDEMIRQQAKFDAAQATCTLQEFLAVNPEQDIYDYVYALERMVGRHYTGCKRDEYHTHLIAIVGDAI